MYTYLYIEINVTCIFILGLILIKLHSNTKMGTDKMLFACALILSVILFSTDIVWAIMDGLFVDIPRTTNWILNVFFMCMIGLLSYSWFIYTTYNIRLRRLKNRRVLVLYTIPLILYLIISITTVWTKWVFYLDENNQYCRGNLYMMAMILGYGYIFWGAMEAMFIAIKEKNYVAKRKNYTLASFVILPLVGGLLQVQFYGIPTTCVGITLSFLMLFMSYQDDQISLDALTLLNNRNQLIKHLSAKMGMWLGKNQLYLMMLDMDGFKQINDRYGHIEGDAALVRVADLLKKACGKRNCFIARYGGDEFVIVYECDAEEEIQYIKQEIHELLEQNNKNYPYNLSLSIGCAIYEESMETIQQFIGAADKELYKEKRKKEN